MFLSTLPTSSVLDPWCCCQKQGRMARGYELLIMGSQEKWATQQGVNSPWAMDSLPEAEDWGGEGFLQKE